MATSDSVALHSMKSNIVMKVKSEALKVDINDHYIIESELGSGGYGKVFIGRDKNYKGRTVAIKKVRIGNMGGTDLRSLTNEANIMQSLDHPHICKLYAYHQDRRFIYFVMENLQGGELFDRIYDDGNVPERETSIIIEQVAKALKYAHANKIVHRDIKPENIVFTQKGRSEEPHVKVIDWGLSKSFANAMDRLSSNVGSAVYSAPEVVDPDASTDYYDQSCDLWSLGVVAYCTITGKPPFWGSQRQQVQSMKSESYPRDSVEYRNISSEGKDLIVKLMKAKPAARMTIDQVLSHEWFASQRAKGPLLRSASENTRSHAFRSMQKYREASHFFNLCTASMAKHLDHSDKHVQDMYKIFNQLDTDKDGSINLDEIRTGFAMLFGNDSADTQQVEQMFRDLDLDGNGTIDYTEFMAGAIGKHIHNQDDILFSCFRRFDVNNDGVLDRNELRTLLKQGQSELSEAWSPQIIEQVVGDIMAEFDKNGNGSIDWDEFKTAMRKNADDLMLADACEGNTKFGQDLTKMGLCRCGKKADDCHDDHGHGHSHDDGPSHGHNEPTRGNQGGGQQRRAASCGSCTIL